MIKFKNTFLKLFICLLTILCISIPTAIFNASESEITTLKVHYYRYDQSYDGWALWLWSFAPTAGTGNEYVFTETDDYGAVATINLEESGLSGTTTMGIIVKTKGSWDKKDVDADRTFDLIDHDGDGIAEAYLCQEESKIGTYRDDPNGPDVSDKIRKAYFKTEKTVEFTTTFPANADSFVLKANGEVVDCNISYSGLNGTITLASNCDMSKSYTLYCNFANGKESTVDVTFDGLFDTAAFERAFGYDGDDLGAVVKDNTTTFKVWAPLASSMKLKLYSTGTPKRYGGSDEPTEVIEMTKDVKGTWVHTINSNMHNTYYNYVVTNGTNTNEVVDPYAKATGVNGLRGLVVDFSKVNPKGWTYNSRPNNMTSEVDAVIYELHVRDLTSHSSWGGSKENAAKYLGLREEGTSYNGVTTGFDHIKELGVTHVQLLPIFDFGVVDETRLNDPKYLDGIGEGYNWGYMPLNYNSLEGSYSSDPYDGLSSIAEMKQVVMAYSANNIRINMDVVYNHTGPSGDSNLNLLVPGYYHRINADGSWSNGSGCGNEVASERYMVSKFIVDSVLFWAQEYNFSGFRFDLMALLDTNTMNALANKLKAIDSTIMIYGEPWNGGSTPLSSSIAADKVNLEKMPHVGAFSDDFRDGVKGSVFSASEDGWIQGKHDNMDKVKYGIVGGTNYPGLNKSVLSYSKVWHGSPHKTINYVTCHDNNTLYDKLMLSLNSKQKQNIADFQKQANAITLLSQGVPFIHAGAEIMRSKPAFGDDGYSENSYDSPDYTNQIRWDKKANETTLSVFNYYKGLIALRKAHPAFRMTSSSDIASNLEFVNLGNNLLAFKLKNYANGDDYQTILVVFNNESKIKIFTTPAASTDWTVIGDKTKVGTEIITTYAANTNAVIKENETLVLVEGYVEPVVDEPVVDEPSKSGCGFGTVVTMLSAISVASFAGVVLLRRKH